MESLRSVVDRLAGEDLARVDDDQLEAGVAGLFRDISLAQAEVARRVAEAKRRSLPGRRYYASLTRWVAVLGDLDGSEAAGMVRLAELLDRRPDTAAAVRSGEVSVSRARALARAEAPHPMLYRRDEAMLLGFARDLDHGDFTRAVRYWRTCADDTLAVATAARQRRAAYLHASVGTGGMVHLDGLLDPETGEAVLTAIVATMPPPVAGDDRPASNRRAEALGTICEQWLRSGIVNGGQRASVTLTVDLDTLEGRLGRHCELDHTGPVTRETAWRMLCDADVCPVLTRAGGREIFDLGRTARFPSPGCGGRSPCAIGTAGSRVATVPPPCATPTTSSTGYGAAAPISTTCCSSAAGTTRSSTKAERWSRTATWCRSGSAHHRRRRLAGGSWSAPAACGPDPRSATLPGMGATQDGEAAYLGFRWRRFKNGDVEITRDGRAVTLLRGRAAERFVARVVGERVDEQQVMARVTGNYRRGNERV